ncbi:kinase, partial [Pseudomonas juntendi]|nr:kinase [Pseudomonas juntendi]
AWESAPFNIDTALTSPEQAVAMITERFLSKA